MQVEVIAESILVTESIAACAFLMDSVFEMAPGRHRSEVQVLFGDGTFRGGGLLENLGMEGSCNFIRDWHHLLHEDWPNYFGLRLWPSLTKLMSTYLHSNTEAQCLEQAEAIRDRLGNRRDWHNYFENEVHAHRKSFVYCYIKKYIGNLGRKGSSPAEQNHSSCVRRISKHATVEPAVAVERMLVRQADQIKVRNHKLYLFNCETVAEARKIKCPILKEATLKLSSWGYELFVTEYQEHTNYEVVRNWSSGDTVVKRKDSEAAPRKLGKCNGDGTISWIACDCPEKIAHKIQCRHESQLEGKLNMSQFDKRWHIRSGVEKSLNSGNYKCNVCDDIPSVTHIIDATKNLQIADDEEEKEDDVDDVVNVLGDEPHPLTQERRLVEEGLEDAMGKLSGNCPPVKTKTDYGELMRVAQDLVSAASKMDAQKRKSFMGFMIMMQKVISDVDVECDKNVNFENVLRCHLSKFAATRDDLFANSKENTSGSRFDRMVPKPTSNVSAKRKNRLKSKNELQTSGEYF